MALHNPDNFIVPFSTGDKSVFIRNINTIVDFEIQPDMVTTVIVDNYNIRVKQKNNYSVIIEFRTHTEAVIALPRLQEAIDNLKNTYQTSFTNAEVSYINNLIQEQGSYAYHQVTASYTWSVATYSMKRIPTVTITNEAHEQIDAKVEYVGTHSVNVYFNQLMNGWLYLT